MPIAEPLGVQRATQQSRFASRVAQPAVGTLLKRRFKCTLN
jgi:hypothetical protein